MLEIGRPLAIQGNGRSSDSSGNNLSPSRRPATPRHYQHFRSAQALSSAVPTSLLIRSASVTIPPYSPQPEYWHDIDEPQPPRAGGLSRSRYLPEGTEKQTQRHRSRSLPNLRDALRTRVRRAGTEVRNLHRGKLHATSPASATRAAHYGGPGAETPTKLDRKAPRVLGRVSGAIALARPQVVVIGAPLADESSDGPELVISLPRNNPSPQPSVRFLTQPTEIQPTRTVSEGDPTHSSVRRVLRETKALQEERAAWSDSAVRGVAYGLSARLAERDMKRARRDVAKIRRRKEVKRRREAANTSESDGENGGRARSPFRFGYSKPRPRGPASTKAHDRASRPAVPLESPPVPTSFEPFTPNQTKTCRNLTASQKHAFSRASVSASLRRFARRHYSVARPAPSVSSLASEQTRYVRGQPIRHLRRFASTDSLGDIDSASISSEPVLDIRASGSSEGPGEAVTAPATVGQSGKKLSLVRQNAFVTLPPHLHHLLRLPKSPTPGPRAAMPPSDISQSPSSSLALRIVSSNDDENPPLSETSSLQAARLALTLADRLQVEASTARETSAHSGSGGLAETEDDSVNGGTSRYPFALATPSMSWRMEPWRLCDSLCSHTRR